MYDITRGFGVAGTGNIVENSGFTCNSVCIFHKDSTCRNKVECSMAVNQSEAVEP